MISKIELTNFKSHAHTVVEPGKLTAFVGHNDAGKSNVFRALKLVLLNVNFLDTYIKHGETQATISITIKREDGERTIERVRDRKGGRYKLTFPDGKVEEYRGQQKLNDIIADFTGFGYAQLDKEGDKELLQFVSSQGQLYQALTSPEGLLRRVMTLTAGANLATVKNTLSGELRAVRSNYAAHEAILNIAKDKLEQTEDGKWESFKSRYQEVQFSMAELDKNEEALKVLHEKVNNLERKIDRMSHVGILDRLYKEYELFTNRGNLANALAGNLTRFEHLLDKHHKLSENLETVEAEYREISTNTWTGDATVIGVCPTCGKTSTDN